MDLLKIFIVSTVLLITGCTPIYHVKKVPSVSLNNLKSSNIATNFLLSRSEVKYSETLYRVLWLEEKSGKRDISGVWSSEQERKKIVEAINSSLPLHELKPLSAQSIIGNQDIYGSYQSGLKKDYKLNTVDYPEGSGMMLFPPMSYFSTYPTYEGFKNMRDYLLDNNIEYLFEYLSPDIAAEAIGGGMVLISMQSNLRIIDLRNEKVIWTHHGYAKDVFQLGGDFKKLESDNLKILKEGVNNGVKNLLSSDTLVAAFSP